MSDSDKTKQLIYDRIQEGAGLRGNGDYFFGDFPLYTFQPGTSAAPHEMGIIYDSTEDLAKIAFKVGNIAFLKELDAKLGNTLKITRTKEQSAEWIGYGVEIPQFKARHKTFALALKEMLDQNRYHVPSLVTANFERENGECGLSCNKGQLWSPEYVFHGAAYGLIIAGYDLGDFRTPESLLAYAQDLVHIEAGLKKEKFNAAIKKDSNEHMDFDIKAVAESEEKLKLDLETLIKILE